MRTFISYGVACAALSVGVLIASCGPASAATNLTKNGSFEVPAVPAGDFRLFSTGQAFSGWRVVGVKGNVAVISGKYQGGGITFNAQAGAQWMDLTGLESNLATGVAQSFATTRGTEYHLTFWVGNVYNPGGAFGVSSTIKAYVHGVRVAGEHRLLAGLPEHVREPPQAEPVDQARCHQVADQGDAADGAQRVAGLALERADLLDWPVLGQLGVVPGERPGQGRREHKLGEAV